MSDSEKKILCVGLVCVDMVQIFDQYPSEDSDTQCQDLWWQRGGNASNNCTVLRQLGVSSEFFGTVSNGTHHKFIIDDMKKHKIEYNHIIEYSDYESPVSLIILSEETGSRTIFHHNPGLPELTTEDFKKLDLNNYDWIHFEGRNCTEVRRMMQIVHKWNKTLEKGKKPITISLELKKRRTHLLELVPYADVIIVGRYFATFKGYSSMKETLEDLAQISKLSAKVIGFWGDKGAMGRTSDGRFFEASAYSPKEVKDTLGAGGVFCAAVIYSLYKNKHLEEAIKFGCKLVGLKCSQRGYDHIPKLLPTIS